MCSFERILEATPYKTAAVEPLTSNHTRHPSKKKNLKKKKKGMLEKKRQTYKRVLLWTLIHGHTSVQLLAKIHIHQLGVDTGCCLEDLPKAMSNGDR